MTALLIAEDLFLLTHDDESGKARSTSLTPDIALAGALLLDLAEQGLLKIDDRKKVLVADDAVDHPLLADARAVIAADSKERPVAQWVNLLPRRMRPLPPKVGDSLVARRVLDREEKKTLGLFTTTRWPERDPQPERELRAGLVDVLVRGTTATPHQELLVPLLHGLNLLNKIVDKDDRRAARETGKAMTKAAREGRLVSASVSQAIQATQSAILAAVVASSATAAAASN